MISSAELLIIAVIYSIYSLAIFGLILVLRRLKVPMKIAIVSGFLIFGVAMGFGVAWLWPLNDIGVVVNIPAALIGVLIYQWSIKYLGDPSSFQAHYTIPWILRIPQVYVLASVLFWGLVGLLIQIVRNGWMRTASLKYRHHLPQGRELI